MPEADISTYLSENPQGLKILGLVSDVRTKKLALADIQRDSVWDSKAAKQLDLFRSMYLGIPIGVLYVWQPTKIEDLNRSRHLDGLNDYYDQDKVKYLILDGQQRTTSICRLHLSKTTAQSHLMDRVVLDLSKDPRMNKVFRFEKDVDYVAKSNEIVIQKLLVNEGLTKETQRISTSELDDGTKIKYLSKLNEVLIAFTTREIAVQYINSNANLQDALRIFSTVNQAGVALADPDFIQALFTSIWPSFHTKIYKLIEILQSVQTGTNDDGKPIYSTLGGFKRDIILKCILWQFFRTTKRKEAVVNENLSIYNPRILNVDSNLVWSDMSPQEKEGATIPLTQEKLRSTFTIIETAAKKLKKNLTDELYFVNNTGHSDNSILGGIIFHINNPTTTDENLGKMLLWYTLSSYHLEWTGGSTDKKVNHTCASFSNENGVQWGSLWTQMQQHSQIDKKIQFSGSVSDLYPKISPNGFPGTQSGTTGKASGIIIQLLEKSLPFSLRMRDWFTGEKLWSLDHKQFSIHHIFPQSRFKTNQFTKSIIELGSTYEDLEDESHHKFWKNKLDVTCEKVNTRKLENQAKLSQLSEQIVSLKNDIEGLNNDLTSALKEQLVEKRKKLMKKRVKINKNTASLQTEIQTYEASIKDFEMADSIELRTKALRNACEFWFSYSKKRLFAMEHPANKISIKLKSNSSIGNSWPHNYLQSLVEHEKRICKQFMKLDDMSLFTSQRFSDFIENRTKWQHSSLIRFLDSLKDGNWGDIQPESSLTNEEILSQEVEIGVERKETIYFDIEQNKSTWDILKSGGKNIHYLRSTIIRAVIAFGNSGGGHVLVGVADEGEIVGLDRDIEVLRNRYNCSVAEAKDKITVAISEEISNTSQEFCHSSVDQEWIKYEDKPILMIKVRGFSKIIKHKKYPKTGLTADGSVVLKEMMKNVHWIRLDGKTEECHYQN